jgi:hypothetical protein
MRLMIVEMAPTAEGSATRTITSAEYIVTEIKQHKRGALLVLAALVVARSGVRVSPRYQLPFTPQ